MKRALLLCLTLAGSQLAVMAQSSAPSRPFGDLTSSAFVNELKTILGESGIDCGTSSSKGPIDSLAACGQSAFQDHKPFFLSYLDNGKNLLMSGYGLAGNTDGNVFVLIYRFYPAFPAVVTRRSKVADGSHTQITKCAKPVRLGKTEEGMLACVIPVNQEESDRVAHQTPIDTSVCAVLENPSVWNNKLVRIRGHYSGNFEYSNLSADGCDESLWFEYAGGDGPPSLAAHVGGGARPGSEDADGRLILPVPIALKRDSKFEQFEKQVKAMAKADDESFKKNQDKFVDHCVTATFTGRIDAVSPEIHQFHKAHPKQSQSDFSGFGQMGSFDGQFILQSVDSDAVMEVCKD